MAKSAHNHMVVNVSLLPRGLGERDGPDKSPHNELQKKGSSVSNKCKTHVLLPVSFSQ